MLYFLIAQRRFGQTRPLHKAFIIGLDLDDMSLAWPAVVQLVDSLTLARSGCRISQEYYSLFHQIVINLIFMLLL